jgi:hypothetical protein
MVSSLACNPTSLGPNSSTTCVVTLAQPAPAGGATVTLTNTNSTLGLPTSVTVAAGVASASFNATTAGIASSQIVTVTASYNGSSANASIGLIASVMVSSLTCNPTSLGPDSSTSCVVALTQPAMAGGATVTLSNTSSALTVPASVTVAPGVASASFSATTSAISSPQTATITAVYSGSSTYTSISLAAGQGTTPPTAGFQFVPVTPCRVIDTRVTAGTFGGPSIAGGSTRNVPIPQSVCNIPSTAQAYSLNVTVVPSQSLTYLTVWPAGQAQPVVSTLNSLSGSIVANAAIVSAGAGGAISMYASNTTDVVIDINGYFAPPSTPGAMSFYTATPCRVVDTRAANGPFGGPYLSGGSTRSFVISSSVCGIPATAQAYSLNVTVVPHGPLTYLTTWPTGQAQPMVSTLNSLSGGAVANAAVVPGGTGGAVSVYVTNDTDLIIDINGYFAPPGSTGALSLYTLTPCRVVDTRSATGTFGGPALTANGTRSFPVQSSACGVPSTAQAYSLNVTVVPPGPLTYLTAWPAGQTQPMVSTLNSPLGAVLANAAIVPAGVSGAVSIFASNPTGLVLDINAYFAQ